MLTRRQKRSLRAFAAALSCCMLLSGLLVYAAVTNGVEAEPVVFADILEGARISADEIPEHFVGNIVTVESAALTETMFSAELRTYTRPTTAADDDMAQGAGGTLLLNTTPKTSETPQTTAAPPETSPPETTPPKTERTTTARSVSYASKRSTTEPAPVLETRRTTTPPRTTTTTTTTKPPVINTTTQWTSYATIHTAASKEPFLNVGGGVMSDDDSVYLALFELVNEARREAGVNELWYSARLHDVCRVRVVELTSYYSHTRPNGRKFSTAFSELGITFKICGENIAYGRNMFKTPEEVFAAWMESQSHRENILYPDYDCAAFGLSVIKVGKDTYYYWTQEFAKF